VVNRGPPRTTREVPVEPARRHERLLTEPGTSLPERTSAWRALVEIRTRVPDLQRLLGLLETRLLAATDKGEQATLHALAGELWRGRLGNTERARAEFDRAVLLDAGSPRAHLGLGILEMDRGHLEAAIEHLFLALVNHGPPGGGLLAEEELAAFHRFRRALAQVGRTDQLVVQAERLLAANPASRPALDAVDGALSQSRAWAPLLAHYTRALAGSDDGRRNARLWRRQAEILQAMGDAPAALRALAEAVRVHPDDVHTRIAALRLGHQLGDQTAIVLHGEALLQLPIERWLSAVESDPEWLRHPEALRRTVAEARSPR
jgi:tetratricopeptide (TPR) repeat protein